MVNFRSRTRGAYKRHVKYDDLEPGLKVWVDGAFSCMTKGPQVVEISPDGDFYIQCNEGMHFLEGQRGPDGKLVGIFWPPVNI